MFLCKITAWISFGAQFARAYITSARQLNEIQMNMHANTCLPQTAVEFTKSFWGVACGIFMLFILGIFLLQLFVSFDDSTRFFVDRKWCELTDDVSFRLLYVFLLIRELPLNVIITQRLDGESGHVLAYLTRTLSTQVTWCVCTLNEVLMTMISILLLFCRHQRRCKTKKNASFQVQGHISPFFCIATRPQEIEWYAISRQVEVSYRRARDHRHRTQSWEINKASHNAVDGSVNSIERTVEVL